MTTKPQPLTPEYIEIVRNLNSQHPKTWTAGAWYPADMNGVPVEIKRTQSRGVSYLKVRKQVTVTVKDPAGRVLGSRKSWEYYTVNLRKNTISYIGF